VTTILATIVLGEAVPDGYSVICFVAAFTLSAVICFYHILKDHKARLEKLEKLEKKDEGK
jgi:hypothetical protein